MCIPTTGTITFDGTGGAGEVSEISSDSTIDVSADEFGVTNTN